MRAQTTPRRLQNQSKTVPRTSASFSIRVTKNQSTDQKSKSQSNQSFSKKSKTRVESMLNDTSCIQMRKSLEKQQDFSQIDNEQLNRLISHLREYTQHCAIKEKYNEARRAQNLGEKAKLVLSNRTKKFKQTKSIVDQHNESRSRFEKRWRDHFNNYQQETLEKREELQKKHAHETRIFERQWAHEMPHKYRKPSQRLLQLKQIEKSLAISGEIDRADYIHSQVETQTQIEIENAQASLIHDYQIARAKHFERQMQEFERFEETREAGRQLLEADYKAEQLRVKHRDWVVQSHIKDSITKVKSGDNPPTRSAGVPKNRDATIGALLPRLIAPNDPSLLKNEKMRRKQIYEKQQHYQKKIDQYINEVQSKQSQRSPSATSQRPQSSLTSRSITDRSTTSQSPKAKTFNTIPSINENDEYYSDYSENEKLTDKEQGMIVGEVVIGINDENHNTDQLNPNVQTDTKTEITKENVKDSQNNSLELPGKSSNEQETNKEIAEPTHEEKQNDQPKQLQSILDKISDLSNNINTTDSNANNQNEGKLQTDTNQKEVIINSLEEQSKTEVQSKKEEPSKNEDENNPNGEKAQNGKENIKTYQKSAEVNNEDVYSESGSYYYSDEE